MKHQKLWARFFLVAAILTAVLIFWFSAQHGDKSQVMSDGITLRVARVIKPGFNRLSKAAQSSYLEWLGTIVRKNAHFLEFMLLGFNLACWLRLEDLRADPRRRALMAWGIATVYAGTDELHQLFISARNAAVLDVAIDSAGSLVGVLVALLGLHLLLKRMRNAP